MGSGINPEMPASYGQSGYPQGSASYMTTTTSAAPQISIQSAPSEGSVYGGMNLAPSGPQGHPQHHMRGPSPQPSAHSLGVVQQPSPYGMPGRSPQPAGQIPMGGVSPQPQMQLSMGGHSPQPHPQMPMRGPSPQPSGQLQLPGQQPHQMASQQHQMGGAQYPMGSSHPQQAPHQMDTSGKYPNMQPGMALRQHSMPSHLLQQLKAQVGGLVCITVS